MHSSVDNTHAYFEASPGGITREALDALERKSEKINELLNHMRDFAKEDLLVRAIILKQKEERLVLMRTQGPRVDSLSLWDLFLKHSPNTPVTDNKDALLKRLYVPKRTLMRGTNGQPNIHMIDPSYTKLLELLGVLNLCERLPDYLATYAKAVSASLCNRAIPSPDFSSAPQVEAALVFGKWILRVPKGQHSK